jgi:hypothetical protein
MYIEQAFKGENMGWRVLLTTLLTTGIFIPNFIMFFLMSREQMDEVFKTMDKLPKYPQWFRLRQYTQVLS